MKGLLVEDNVQTTAHVVFFTVHKDLRLHGFNLVSCLVQDEDSKSGRGVSLGASYRYV